MKARIVLLPGDGIGPEVVHEARLVLDAIAAHFGHAFEFDEQLIGGAAIDATGGALPPGALAACRAADAILLGAVGGPTWDDPSAKVRPEQGLLALRKELDLWANLRPVRPFPELAACSPLRPERLAGTDVLVIRELTGGLYFGQPRLRDESSGRRARGRHPRVHRPRDRAGRRARVRAGPRAAAPGDLDRQGQRARVVAAVAPGRRRGRVPLPRRQARPPAGRLGRDAPGLGAGLRST